jgi:hypothetical protein
MGELIELVIKGVGWLVVLSVYALWHAARLTVLAIAYIVRVTIQLVGQRNSPKFSPDRRNWWNGQKWVPALPTTTWIVPAVSIGVLLVAGGICMANLKPVPTANPGTVAVRVTSPAPSLAVTSPAVSTSTSPAASTATSLPAPTPAATPTSGFGPGRCPTSAGISFPADFPTYPGAVLAAQASCTGFASPVPATDVDLYSRWTTADSGQQVVDFYGPSLQQHGWTVTKVYPPQSDGSAGISFGPDNHADSVDYAKVASGGVIEVWIWVSAGTPVAASALPPPPPALVPTANLCGAPPNPFGYDFCSPGNVIYGPPSNFCVYFDCIKSFWDSTNGYVDECQDATYSHSGGRQGACSYHGGELRPLYSH